MTLAEQVYHALRRDIVQGALAPGQPLRLGHLGQRYGVGASPLREALNRLQGERLVVSVALRGFTVAPLSLPEMWDAINSRILVETEALRLSIRRGGDDWGARVVAAQHALTLQAGRTGPDPDAMETRHREFHTALISACGSDWLLDFAGKLYMATRRYRQSALSGASGRDLRREHADLMQAALNRDAEGAAALLDRHYRQTGEAQEAAFAAACPVAPDRARQTVSR